MKKTFVKFLQGKEILLFFVILFFIGAGIFELIMTDNLILGIVWVVFFLSIGFFYFRDRYKTWKKLYK